VPVIHPQKTTLATLWQKVTATSRARRGGPEPAASYRNAVSSLEQQGSVTEDGFAFADKGPSHIDRRERLAAADQIGRLLGDHDDRRVDVAADQVRHDRGVDHAQPLDPEDAQLAVDHRRVLALGTHPAGAERVMDADPCRPDMSVDLLIGGFARPRRDLGGDERLQRCLFRVTRLRDQTIPQLTAKLARRKLAEIQPSQGAPAQTIVDGREGAPLDSVRSGGRIVFRFADLGPVLDWIWEQLVTRSPVGGLGGASCGLRRCTASSASWR
jgi:hypothetical protein